jgi:hypothetical protein
MRLDRVSGELTIWKSIGDSLTENYRGNTIIRVDPLAESTSDQFNAPPTDYKFPFSLLIERNLILYTSSARELATWVHELQRFQVIKNEEQVRERGADFMVYKLEGASEFLNFWSETLTVSMMKTSG